ESLFARIIEKGLKYAFATNNSTKSVDTYVGLLTEFNIPVNKDQVNTSATVTAKYLQSRFQTGTELFVIGMDGLRSTLLRAGFKIGIKSPSAVVVGLDDTFDYQTLKLAADLVRAGIPFIGTNPDVSLPTPTGFNPGTGSILASIEAASGMSPVIIGKPQAAIFQAALQNLGTSPEQTLVIGDRVDTDIAGGQAAGCKVGLVLSGASSLSQARTWQPAIDFIADDLTNLIEELNE
ncbi:MAG: HAD-IIA family hydrolase, partial [Anaerolineales bacterium]